MLGHVCIVQIIVYSPDLARLGARMKFSGSQ